MLRLDHIALRRGPNLLIEDAELRVHAGQRVGLVGRNGSGKSSLFALIRGELEPDAGSLSLPPDTLIAHVAQEAPASGRSALDYVMDGDAELRELQDALNGHQESGDHMALARVHERMEAIDGYAAEARAGRLLHGLGFAADAVGDPVAAFSGGWRVRLALARALMCRSDLLLLDEPTNHLDLPAILWLEQWLKSYGGMLMVISHDRDFMDGICTHVAHIEDRRLQVYTGNYSEFESRRAEQLALRQAMHEKQQREIQHIQRFIDRFRYKATKARQAQSRVKMLERMTRIAPAHVDSPFHFEFPAPQSLPQHLLQLQDVEVGYDSAVLSGIRLNIAAGARLGLLGVNGAGKSTLVKAMATGETLLAGTRTLHKDAVVGYFAQHQLELLDPQSSPMQHLMRQSPGLTERDARRFLGGFDFSDDRVFEPVAPFSGGEKARLVLALIVQQRPNLLLLDEPTNHLDLEMRHALTLALQDYSGALVVISHDRHLLRSACDELLLVHDGRCEPFDHDLDYYTRWVSGDQRKPVSPRSPQ
ncbi:MAG TPA: ATP-binding cassette domain-containing protein, partial [Arenicellales bacterium]|nr:ATP-binding cassette domain-containing protein [Arenicellales bacterium]